MFWWSARTVFEECRRAGLCRSQRDFSQRLLGRGRHYMRLVTNRRAFVSRRSTRTLRSRLVAAAQGGRSVKGAKVTQILGMIDEAEQVAAFLRREGC